MRTITAEQLGVELIRQLIGRGFTLGEISDTSGARPFPQHAGEAVLAVLDAMGTPIRESVLNGTWTVTIGEPYHKEWSHCTDVRFERGWVSFVPPDGFVVFTSIPVLLFAERNAEGGAR